MKLSLLRLAAAAASVAIGMAWSDGAQAQDKRVRMQMAGAFPSSMQILGAAQLRTVDLIKRLSSGSIDMRFYEPGALVPGSQYFDAVSTVISGGQSSTGAMHESTETAQFKAA